MLLLRGATFLFFMLVLAMERFNTCSSCEEQQSLKKADIKRTLFQYMLLLRGATYLFRRLSDDLLFQYMLLLRGAT